MNQQPAQLIDELDQLASYLNTDLIQCHQCCQPFDCDTLEKVIGDIFNPEITAIETSWDDNSRILKIKNKVEELRLINLKKIMVVNYVIE